MDKKAIDESIKFRQMLQVHFDVELPRDIFSKNNLVNYANLVEGIYWLTAHVGSLVSQVEDLQKEVKTLKRGKK